LTKIINREFDIRRSRPEPEGVRAAAAAYYCAGIGDDEVIAASAFNRTLFIAMDVGGGGFGGLCVDND
jgi:hypothetical protein